MTDIVYCGMCIIGFVYHYFVPWQLVLLIMAF